jgi:hypothetical protein
MVAKTSLSIEQLPAEMVAAVAVDAARDADRVIQFLSRLGLGATPEKPRAMPAEFLLHLGVALRLLNWESQGFFFHREMGLPEADRTIQDAFLSLTDPAAVSTELLLTVLRLSVERLAWGGPSDLAADVALDELTDDGALDLLAEFLWASRHAHSVTGNPQS